jgi:CubicO group peptidase (beta-lactamase class C family)
VGPRADYWPTEGWRSTAPEEQGLDPKILSEIDYDVKETFPAVKGVLVVRNGYVVFENYYQGYDRSDHHHVWSVTKSVISALVGVALKEDRIQSLDQRLSEFFPEHFGPGTDPRKRQITVKNLLTMTNGFRLNSFYNNKGFERIMSSDDMVEASIGQPMAKEPGEEFNYNDGDANLISAILTKTTGQSLWRSRSTRMVPGALPLLKPKSSTPKTRTSSASARKDARMRLRRVSGLTSRPSSRARLAPASPPKAKAIHSSAFL